jgi:CHAT domain-containing protein
MSRDSLNRHRSSTACLLAAVLCGCAQSNFGAAHTYSADVSSARPWRIEAALRARDSLIVHASQRNLNVAISLQTPDGHALVRVDSPMQRIGAETLYYQAAKPGSYIILVESAEPIEAARPVNIQLERISDDAPWRFMRAHRSTMEAYASIAAQSENGSLKAKSKLEQAVKDFKRARAPRELANSQLMLASHLYFNLAEWRDAARTADGAFRAFERLEDVEGAADALALKGAALVEAAVMPREDASTSPEQDLHAAREALLEASSRHEANGQLFQQARDINLLGLSHHYQHDTTRARAYFAEAEQRFSRLKEPTSAAMALQNLAAIESAEGDYQEAAAAFDRLLTMMDRNADPLGYADVLNNRAVALSAMGEFDRSLSHNLEALEIRRAHNDVAGQGRTLHSLGIAHRRLGDRERALEYLQQAEKVRRRVNDGRGLFATLAGLGDVAHEMGLYEDSRRYLRAAEAEAKSELDRARVCIAMMRNASAQQDASSAVRYQEQFRKLAVPESHPYYADFLIEDARRLELQGNVEGGLRLLRSAAEKFAALRRPLDEARALHYSAQMSRAAGDSQAALNSVNRAIEIYESLRAGMLSPDLGASLSDLARTSFDLKLELLLGRRGSRQGAQAIEALLVVERARSRNLLNALERDPRRGAGPGVGDGSALDRLYQRLVGKTHRYGELLEKASPPTEQAEALKREILEIEAAIAAAESSLAQRPARASGVDHFDSTALARLQTRLQNSAIVSYFLANPASWAFVISHSQVTAVQLPAAQEIAPLADEIADHLRGPGAVAPLIDATKALNRLILEPLPIKDSAEIIVVMDGALHRVPLAWLLTSFHGSPLASAYAPSVTALASETQIAAPFERTAPLVIAAPQYDLDGGKRVASPRRLPGADLEIDAITALREREDVVLLRGRNVTPEQLQLAAQKAAVLHFAGHGFENRRNPTASHLLFPPLQGIEPYQWTAGEIRRARIPAALVVLSACETAAGRSTWAEGMNALALSFLQAGASAVVATSWRTPDSASAELMTHFYRELYVNQQSAIAALALAQSSVRRGSAHAHPYYWAGFRIVIRQPETLISVPDVKHLPRASPVQTAPSHDS